MYPALNGTLEAGRVDWLGFGRLAAKVGYRGVDILPGSAMKAGGRVQINHSQDLSPDNVRDNERLMPAEGAIDLAGFVQALFGRGLNNVPPEEGARVGLDTARAVMRKAGVA